MRRPDVDKIAATLADAGLEPVIDREREAILARCPCCQSPPPDDYFRALEIGTYGGIRFCCWNDCPDARVEAALLDRIAASKERSHG